MGKMNIEAQIWEQIKQLKLLSSANYQILQNKLYFLRKSLEIPEIGK